jgi:hypothetical protein
MLLSCHAFMHAVLFTSDVLVLKPWDVAVLIVYFSLLLIAYSCWWVMVVHLTLSLRLRFWGLWKK